ncbi:MAG: YbhB/YbcL family Raf kinase inhibitor-like protein [Bacteriovoracaceae bacterium]|nr:YbhB/YbcL family Raf kinase inhibitor-like protein [Bacteriovoracaceae bacterium]
MNKHMALFVILSTILMFTVGCGSGDGDGDGTGGTVTMTLTSDQLTEGSTIAGSYADGRVAACSGAVNNFPGLSWSGAPAETSSYVIIVQDPDGEDSIHLNLYDISSSTTSIPLLNANPSGQVDMSSYGTEGQNYRFESTNNGWAGPCPPSGDSAHTYIFKVYALNIANLPTPLSNSKQADFESSYSSNILGSGQLTGKYANP